MVICNESNYRLVLISLFLSSISIACRKFSTVGPPDYSVAQNSVYSNDQTAIAALTGLYVRFQSGADKFSIGNISFFAGLSADEFRLWPGADIVDIAYYTNSLSASSSNSVGHEYWTKLYEFIYTCNSAIEGLNTSEGVSPSTKKQLIAEAKFLRAFLYFYLVNLYGDVPLVTSISYETNRILPRVSKDSIYTFIIKDLSDARESLSEIYLDGGLRQYNNLPERVRPTKWAASALLSRVFLYTQNNYRAIDMASEVISNSSLFSLVSLSDVFLKNNNEAIWQLQGTEPGFNTQAARIFNLNSDPVGFDLSKPAYNSEYLQNSFEPGDDRKTKWINAYWDGVDSFYFPFKYKIANYDPTVTGTNDLTEYLTVLRLGELYLVRAEAYAKLGDIINAAQDINEIRSRARALPTLETPNPIPPIPNNVTQTDMLAAIEHERFVELFSEWGHRWLDLKRNKRIDEVMALATVSKGGTWLYSKQLYPLPLVDILRNPKLSGNQNPGY